MFTVSCFALQGNKTNKSVQQETYYNGTVI